MVDRGWEVEVVPLVAGQRSVKEKEWIDFFRIFGIGKDDDKKILQRLWLTLLNEHGNSSAATGGTHLDPRVVC